MRKLFATLIMVGVLVTPAVAAAQEEGATFFEDGSCVEADGAVGVSMIDGTCSTIADYNELFSYENLAATPSAIDPSVSIADEAGLVDDVVPPALRVLGEGVSEPHQFVDYFAPESWVRVYKGHLIK